MAFTDRMDVNMKISLYEYGIIRNPETDKVIFCHNTYFNEGEKPLISVQYISMADVIEALEDMEDGFWSFLGLSPSDIDGVIKNDITNDGLAYWIYVINFYCGYFFTY